MTRPKKNLELWRLERFKSFFADFPNGRIEPTEEPDFLVHDERLVFGIELTDLHRETLPGHVPQQASEAMQNRVINRAKEIYASRGHEAVLATFHLDDRIHIKKAEVERLATELADLVSQNIPLQNSTTEVPTGWNDRRRRPRILHKLSIRRFDIVTKTFFSAPRATWIGTISRNDIERTLETKEPKYPTYRQRCDEVWLIINTDIESITTWFEFDEVLLAEVFVTNFNRVFLVQHFQGKAHELNVSSSDTW